MSRWAGICQLIAQSISRDDYGVEHACETRRQVPCNVYSMGAQSYYAAAAAGVRPSAVLQIRKPLYQGEQLVEFESRVLSVDRVVSTPDFTTLTLVEKVGNRGH